jgi:spermidine synthase
MTGPILRRRDDGATELRVNGVFVMDDRQTASERALARAVVGRGARDVLVGGLGLGFTLRELLTAPVRRVVVVERHREIVDWMRDGTIAGADLLTDPRVEVVLDDVRAAVVEQPAGSLDAIVLDIDNGPDFLVHDDNAAVYGPSFVGVCAERLRPGGHLCVWSMAPSDTVVASLRASFERVEQTSVPVRLQDRAEHYWILTGSHPRR